MKILVDVSGSGVKIKTCANGGFSKEAYSFKSGTCVEFYDNIQQLAKGCEKKCNPLITGISVVLAGKYDYANERAVSCWGFPFLVGTLKSDIQKQFGRGGLHDVDIYLSPEKDSVMTGLASLLN